MSETTQQRMIPRSPTIAMTPTGLSIPISRRYNKIWTILLFCAIAMGAMIGVPLYGYLYHYTWLDWSLFGCSTLSAGWALRSATIG